MLREIDYIKVLKRRNKNYDLLPQYYGEIETNLGHGYLFEVIRNFDKSKSITLQEILQNFDGHKIAGNDSYIKDLLIFLPYIIH